MVIEQERDFFVLSMNLIHVSSKIYEENGYGLDLDLHILSTNRKFNDPRKGVV
jgi:hypothetical protein